ncbi:MAG TPA: FAD-linked oxidase C-terminal domain-containing protein [Chloroflexota bacterium]|nr:FAD-linked oxidase C-terminal domain-containing protein [Chloroflexota bacterium]
MAVAQVDARQLVRKLEAALGVENVLWRDYDLRLYEYDGSIDKARPQVVVFPTSTAQVAEVVRLCNEAKVPLTARGAGTGLSGGSIPLDGGVLMVFSRLNHILEVDLENLRAVVEPGVVNLYLSQAIAGTGLHFVPDPSSQKACTIGGNVGENSGGPHTLLYGVTTNHVTGLEFVTSSGEVIETGGKALDAPGYDLTGLIVGSEGTFGVVTRVIVRLSPLAEAVKTVLAVFDRIEDASATVSGVIAAGIVPSAIEMMDQLSIQAVEAAVHAGYPTDAAAVLLIEIDSLQEGIEDLLGSITKICEENRAREIRTAKTAKERNLLWLGRKGAFGAMGRVSPDFYVMDGCVPRDKLPEVLTRIEAISQKYGLRIANVFHAGDGNLHPLVLFDSEHPGEEDKVREMGYEILAVCADVGGALTGEHGIGFEKREMMGLTFNDDDLNWMNLVKQAMDPTGLLNPGKIFPTPGKCWMPRPRRAAAVGW